MRAVKLVAVLAVLALAPAAAFAQEGDVGEYASTIAGAPGMDIPPGVYAHTAARLADFFARTKGARTVYATDLQVRLANGTSQLVLDIRPVVDFNAGHIPGAVNIPLDVLFRPENLVALPTDGTDIIVVCHTGHTASMALGGLTALGYNAYVLRFGMMGWRASTPMKVFSPTQTSQAIFGLGGEQVK
jgi:rhodanese-related sulfurtransferase